MRRAEERRGQPYNRLTIVATQATVWGFRSQFKQTSEDWKTSEIIANNKTLFLATNIGYRTLYSHLCLFRATDLYLKKSSTEFKKKSFSVLQLQSEVQSKADRTETKPSLKCITFSLNICSIEICSKYEHWSGGPTSCANRQTSVGAQLEPQLCHSMPAYVGP